MTDIAEEIRAHIAEVPDFPKSGINFKDITTALENPDIFPKSVAWFEECVKSSGATAVAGIESRGFIFGAAVAARLEIPLVLVRKPGKLPRDVYREEYELEYGTNALELHCDACSSGDRVLIVDDLLATGGTAKAAVSLVEQTGAEVAGVACLIELSFLDARDAFDDCDMYTLVRY